VLFVSDGGELAKGIQTGRENEVWRLVAEDGEATEFDAVKALNDLVDRDMSGATRILRQRVEQVIQTSEDTILAYKLAILLNFYHVTFAKLLGDQTALVGCLGGLESEALRQFRSLMRDHIAALQGEFQLTPPDMGAPEFLHEALKQLMAIMGSYDTSLAPSDSRESDFELVLAEALDPFLAGCGDMAKNLPSPSDSIFLVNCMTAAKGVLATFEFTSARIRELQAEVEKRFSLLVEVQYRFFCREPGLEGVFAALRPLADKREDIEKVRALEALQPQALMQAGQHLDDFLPSALMDAMENLKQLQDPTLARQITEEAAERFCVDFEHVEEMLLYADELAEQEAGGTEGLASHNLRTLFPRTTGEIRALLS